MRPVFRLLPLPLCIAFSLAAHADDDRPENWSLCPVEDAVPVFADAPPPTGSPDDRALQDTDLACDSTEGVMGGTVVCKGNVTLQRGDQFLHADNLRFDQESSQYAAEGNVRYQDSGMRMVAQSAHGDQDEDTHQIDNVRYQLIERRGNGGADSIRMKGTQGALMGSTYSTCPPNDRHWELQASRIDINTDSGFGTAHNASIRVGKVPILYVPWFRFPIDDRRVTGLLYPNISQSGRNGFDWRQPIYLNLAPNYDMTLQPRLMTKRGLMLNTEFRYLTPSGRGEFDIGYLPSDDLTSRERDQELAEFLDPAETGTRWRTGARTTAGASDSSAGRTSTGRGRRAPTSTGSATRATSRTSATTSARCPVTGSTATSASTAAAATGTPA